MVLIEPWSPWQVRGVRVWGSTRQWEIVALINKMVTSHNVWILSLLRGCRGLNLMLARWAQQIHCHWRNTSVVAGNQTRVSCLEGSYSHRYTYNRHKPTCCLFLGGGRGEGKRRAINWGLRKLLPLLGSVQTEQSSWNDHSVDPIRFHVSACTPLVHTHTHWGGGERFVIAARTTHLTGITTVGRS